MTRLLDTFMAVISVLVVVVIVGWIIEQIEQANPTEIHVNNSWYIDEIADPVGDTKIIVAMLQAYEVMEHSLEKATSCSILCSPRRPVLVIRCWDRKIDIYIAIDNFRSIDEPLSDTMKSSITFRRPHTGNKTTVTTRIGNDDPTDSEWNMSRDRRTTFYSGNGQFYLNKLTTLSSDPFEKNQLVYRGNMSDNSPLTSVFDLTDIHVAVGAVSTECNI